MLLKIPTMAAVREVASVRLSPLAKQSGLSVRSTEIVPATESTSIVAVIGMPSGAAGYGS
jgi:hypothetical protein